MIEKLKTKIRALKEGSDRLESELLSLHTQLYRTETYLKQKEADRVEASLANMRQAVSNLIQTHFYVLKNDISELSSSSFTKMVVEWEAEKEANKMSGKESEVSLQIKRRIRDQHSLLKQYANSHMIAGPDIGGLAKSSPWQMPHQGEDVIADVLGYLSAHHSDMEVQKLCNPVISRSPSADRFLIGSLKAKILEERNRPRSPNSRRTEHSAHHTIEHKEFSVYSDFSFHSPTEDNADAKKLETIKEDLKHVELDEILRISSLPISIQSDDEYRNFEF